MHVTTVFTVNLIKRVRSKISNFKNRYITTDHSYVRNISSKFEVKRIKALGKDRFLRW